jgi:nucleotide-binding universal stress UspA family protein
MFKKILVALDNSAISKSVCDCAIALAQATHAQLMLLHVLNPTDEGYPEIWFDGTEGLYLHDEGIKTYVERWTRYEEQGLEMLRSLTEKATALGIATEFTQTVGSPGQRICALAQTWEADLIVIGRRGRSGLSEMLLGSVSNYVVHRAPCAVYVVQHVVMPSATINPNTQVAAIK